MRAWISIYEIIALILGAGGLGTFWLWIRSRRNQQ